MWDNLEQNSNKKVYAQNGETFDKTAERLGFKKGTNEYESFKKSNSEAANKGWFRLDKEIKVSDDLKGKLADGAYDTDTKVEQAKWKQAVQAKRNGRNTPQQPIQTPTAQTPTAQPSAQTPTSQQPTVADNQSVKSARSKECACKKRFCSSDNDSDSSKCSR